SEADNWYLPDHLSPAMNQVLDSTDEPFGRVVGRSVSSARPWLTRRSGHRVAKATTAWSLAPRCATAGYSWSVAAACCPRPTTGTCRTISARP
ncbi:hypothetical protein C7E18_12155, partial [Stenotrophomonas maltophilia]